MSEDLKKYTGSCHCGAVVFTFLSQEITAGRRCNCSICHRKGAVMSVEYFPPQAFLSLKGEKSLAVYHFGDRTVNHFFCKCCGIYPFHAAIETPGHRRINLGCVGGIDLSTLRIDLINGKDF